MAAHHRLSRPRTYVGADLRFADGTTSRVFRETCTGGVAEDAVVLLAIRFRLAFLDDVSLLHAAFNRECLLHTPLFAGFPGFRSKLWLEDTQTRVYRGIYEWEGAVPARHYADRMVGLLAPFTNRGTAESQIVAGLARDQYLHHPAEAVGTTLDAWWRLAEPVNPPAHPAPR
jgi:hypothetical protein